MITGLTKVSFFFLRTLNRTRNWTKLQLDLPVDILAGFDFLPLIFGGQP